MRRAISLRSTRAGALLALCCMLGPALGSAELGNAANVAADQWKTTAARLTIPVFRPTRTFGLRLDHVTPITGDPGCVNDGRQMLRGFYSSRTSDAYLEIFEGHPRYCSDRPLELPVLRKLRVHGQDAALYRLAPGTYVLEWCERGTVVALKSTGLASKRLVVLARSMRAVDNAPALPCVWQR